METLTVGSRPPVAGPIKQAITDAFAVVPPDKRGALLAIVDESGARLHVATKIGDHWRVGGIVGKPWNEKPFGAVVVEAVW